MANISQVKVGNQTHNIKDSVARTMVSDFQITESNAFSSNNTNQLVGSTDISGIASPNYPYSDNNILKLGFTQQTVNSITATANHVTGAVTVNGTGSSGTEIILGEVVLELKRPTYFYFGGKGTTEVSISTRVYTITNGSWQLKKTIGHGTNDCVQNLIPAGKIKMVMEFASTSGTVSNYTFYPAIIAVTDVTQGYTFKPYPTDMSLTIPDATDGYLQGVTVYGRSEVVDGEIKSVGDAGWGVVDLGDLTWTETKFEGSTIYVTTDITYGFYHIAICSGFEFNPTTTWNGMTFGQIALPNGTSIGILTQKDDYTDATTFKTAVTGVLLYYPLADASSASPLLGITSKDGTGQGTAATITTALPLRSVSDEIYDTLDNTKVVKRVNGGKINDTNIFNWLYHSGNNTRTVFYSLISNCIYPPDKYTLPSFLVTGFGLQTQDEIWTPGNISYQMTGAIIAIVDPNITTIEALLTTYGNEEIYYPLATPTTTPLTAAEISALASLRTYDSTTHIDATDEPEMTVGYLKNTKNGEAVARIDNDLTDKLLNLALLITNAPEMHNNIFRGKNLGSSVTDEQKEAIRTGKFTDLYIGDYWEINDIVWRIADFNYFKSMPPQYSDYNHVVLVPDTALYSAIMVETDYNINGYVDTDMYKTNLATAKTMASTAFPGLISPSGLYTCLPDEISGNLSYPTREYNTSVELMNENMVFGHHELVSYHYNDFASLDTSFTFFEVSQFALFRLAKQYIFLEDDDYWLRDMYKLNGSSWFSNVSPDNGIKFGRDGGHNCGVRPYVILRP